MSARIRVHEHSEMEWTIRNFSAYALVVVVLTLAIAMGLRLYKATYTGIVYDEVATMGDFGTSYHTALTSYKNPNNNHVINSLLVNFCRLHLYSYESSFRLHTMAFSIIYCLAAAYLAWSLVTNPFLRILLAILLLFQYCVFDLSYLCRGYSIAIAAFYFGLAILVFLLKRPLRFRHIWFPILVLVAVNVLTLGSMLSALPIVAALDLCYIAFFFHRVLMSTGRRAISLIVQALSISTCSLALLYAIYAHLWRDILAAKDNFGSVALIGHLSDVLWKGMFFSPTAAGWAGYVVFLGLAAFGLVYAVRTPGRLSAPQSLILSTMLATVLVLFIWRNILDLSLGFARNGVFLIPLFIMSGFILIDTAQSGIPHLLLRRMTVAVACLSAGVMAFEARPSLHAVQISNWQSQSVSGPLVRHLHSIDPQRAWSIGITDGTRTLRLPFLYYSSIGYSISPIDRDLDVIVYDKDDKIAFCHWYRPWYFNDFGVRIALSPAIIQQYHIPDTEFGPLPAPDGSFLRP